MSDARRGHRPRRASTTGSGRDPRRAGSLPRSQRSPGGTSPGPKKIVGAGRPVPSGREDLVVRMIRPGTQRASLRSRVTSRIAYVLAASLLASLAAFGTSAAAPSGAAAAAPPWYDVETYYLQAAQLHPDRRVGAQGRDLQGLRQRHLLQVRRAAQAQRGALRGGSRLGEEARRRRCLLPRQRHCPPSQRGVHTATPGARTSAAGMPAPTSSVLNTHLTFQRRRQRAAATGRTSRTPATRRSGSACGRRTATPAW